MSKKKILSMLSVVVLGISSLCAAERTDVKCYNQGINIIPMPQELVATGGYYTLGNSTAMVADGTEAKVVAEFFAAKLSHVTGYDVKVKSSGDINLVIDPKMNVSEEGYTLSVKPDGVTAKARTAHGLFYAMQSFLQLLPAEVESPELVKNVAWKAPAVCIKDQPRFGYRGIMLDPCRHFMPAENVKKYIDVLALFKINRMHWHLTDDQGWRIESKKYPKLNKIATSRVEGEGTIHAGYYTQEQIKDIVKYAADRFITIVPELELPGHEMAAIAAYPKLSCKGEKSSPRIIWGVEDVVMCPGKEDMFKFMQDIVDEMVALFPGEYFHIGGDECPKSSWKECPKCQQRIKQLGLKSDDKHTAEEKLQSYVIQRMEKYLATKGKKIIGWDEILEGGLAPSATVMSWRGEEGGIAAALMNHNVIMTPGGNGMYLDAYQGDQKIEPVTIGGYTPLKKTYGYNPMPDTLATMGKQQYVLGVQGNCWSEYMYTEDKREYMTFPRILAVAEIGWTEMPRKNYEDFERRLNNAYVRLDGHGINYHIPLPEQPNGSCNLVAFTDKAVLTFTTSRKERMVYTLDGSEPTAMSAEYIAPIAIDKTTTLKIATVLPSGKLSKVRSILVEKQALSAASDVKNAQPGLLMNVYDGMYLSTDDAKWKSAKVKEQLVIDNTRKLTAHVKTSESMRGVKQYAAVAEGYVNIPADGVYYFSSDLEEVWIDGKLLINNGGEVKRYSRHDSSMALQKGLHKVRLVFLGHVIGGWPSNWNDGGLNMRSADEKNFHQLKGNSYFYVK